MQILALKLENVKSYDSAEITFTPGTNAIVGQNGAGKSTVLEAIGFALFDSLAYRQADFVNEGAKSATITVTFLSSHDERSYQIVRRCGSSTQYFVYDPELDLKLYEGKADVQGFLRQHLGVDGTTNLEKLFSDAVGVPQGTFTAAFLEGRAERKSKFDALLQVREYEDAWNRLREPAAALRNQQQTFDVEIAGMAARLEQLPILTAAVTEHRKQINANATELAKIAEQLQAVRSEREALETVQQKIVAVNAALSQLASKSAAADSRLDAARTQLAESQEAAAVIAENKSGYELHLQAETQQQTLDQQVSERQRLRDLRADHDKALALAKAESQTLTTLLDEIATAEQQVATLQDPVATQERLETALIVAQQEASQREQQAQELSRRRNEIKDLSTKVSALSEQLAESGKLESSRAATERSIADLNETIHGGQEALAGLRVQAERLKEQSEQLENIDTSLCPVCEQPLTPDHRQTLMTRNAQDLEAMRERYRQTQQRQETDQAALKKEQASLRDLDGALRRLPRPEELAEAEVALAGARDAATALAAQLESGEDVAQRVESIRAQIEQLGNPRQQMAIAQATAQRRVDADERSRTQTSRQQEAEQKLAEVEEALQAFDGLDDALTRLSKQLASTASAHQAVLSHQRVAGRVDERAAAVKSCETEIESLQGERKALADRLAQTKAGFDEKRFRALLGEEQNLVANHASIDAQLTMVKRSLAADEKTLSSLQAVQQQLATIQEKRDRLAQQERVLEDMRSVIRQAGPFVTRALVQQIGDEAARIFGEIMQDHTRHLSWDEEYLVSLNVDGNERQFSQLSGGEQMSAAIAVRLALLHQMSSIDIAFFDEPTTNLDTARRESLAQQILTVDGLSQLFVISHDDTFEQATENLIRVEQRDGASRFVD